MKRLNLIAAGLNKKKHSAAGGAGQFFLKGAGLKLVAALLLLYAGGVLPHLLLVKPYRIKLDAARNRLQAEKLQLSRLQTQQLSLAKERSALLKKKNLAAEDLEYFRSAKKDKRWQLSEILRELAGLIPADIRLNKLSIGLEQIAINGLASESRAVSDFMARLKEAERFKAPVFNFIQRNEERDGVLYGFEITAYFALGGADAR